MEEIRLIKRGPNFFIRVWNGNFDTAYGREGHGWEEFPLSLPSDCQEKLPEVVFKVRIPTKEMEELLGSGISLPGPWEGSLYWLAVGESEFLVSSVRGTCFDCYDGDFWLPIDGDVRVHLEDLFGGVALGEVYWQKSSSRLKIGEIEWGQLSVLGKLLMGVPFEHIKEHERQVVVSTS